ncbi:MAG TPA: SUMF1/EgtB/PvdO family nonheme iron enzyme, partial [Planctomycetota bacterium]|nr:SUMF1/EgtB/PvdO family nonheme iron enzyme [Planctomycetota bacterium]
TGLAALALLEARAVEGAPPSMEPAWRALEWLMSVQDKSGGYGGEIRGHDVYNHSIATLALIEGYRATGDPWLRHSAARGVDLIVQAQNPFLGWRYGIRPKDNDTSVTVWMVRALAAARDAGIPVPSSAFVGARNWLDKVTERDWGRAGYTAAGNGPARPEALMDKFPADKSESLTAAAVHTRLLCGQAPSDDAVLKGVRLIVKTPPHYDEAAGTIDYYYWHYGTLALQGVGGVDWQRWNETIRRILVQEQRNAADDDRFGSWDAVDPWAKDGGRVYSTALNVLTLTAPFRAGPFREIAETTLLSIDSDPAGATVLADGVPIGTTPLRAAPIHAGKSVLLLRHADREDARVDAVLQPFTDNVLAKVSLPPPAGRVDLSDLPRDAAAFLDGRPAKGVAPARAGRRRLTVVRPGHFTQVLLVDAAEQPVKPILGTWKTAPEWARGPLRGLLPAPPEPALTSVTLPADVIEIEGRLGSRSDAVEMVLVAPDPDGGKPFPAFLIDRHEVTVAQYQAYAKAAGRAMPAQPKGSTPRHPVVAVNAVDAAAYAKWAGKRLPTADEWRHAARERGRPFPWGECDSSAARNLEGRDDGQSGLAPVGNYPAGMSPAGCFDLVGNAAEWVEGGVLVGASWTTPAERVGDSNLFHPEEARGFRCAISIEGGRK